MCDTYCKDEQMAVLISPGYGVGWSTWNLRELAYNKLVVDAFLDYKEGRITDGEFEEHINSLYPNDNIYFGGFDDLQIRWVPFGKQFYVMEYDGYESLVFPEEITITAGPHV